MSFNIQNPRALALRAQNAARNVGRQESPVPVNNPVVEQSGPIAAPDFRSVFRRLLRWHRDRPFVVGMLPYGGGDPICDTFTSTMSEVGFANWCEKYPKHDLCQVMNEPWKGLKKKPAEAEIGSVWYIVTDFDLRKDASMSDEDARNRIIEVLTNGQPENVPPPTVIERANGIKAYWQLSAPVTVNGDKTAIDAFKLRVSALENTFKPKLDGVCKVDSCRSIEHLFRVEGIKCRKPGRADVWVENITDHIDDPAYMYGIEQFPPAKATGNKGEKEPYVCDAAIEVLASIDDLPRRVLKWQRTMILNGYNEDAPDKEIVKGFNELKAKQGVAATDKPYASKSEAVYAIIGYCKYAGVSDGILLNILSDERWGISAHCWKHGGIAEARRQIEHWRNDPQTTFNEKGLLPPDSILHEGGRLLESIDAMNAVLLSESARPIYQRGEFLVRPTTIGVAEAGEKADGIVETNKDGEKVVKKDGIDRPIGTSTIRRVSTMWIQREVAAHSKWCQRAAKGFSAIDPPRQIAEHILEKVGEWRFPVLNGILNTPTIRPDGSLFNVSGYDKASGLLLDTGGAVFPSVPETPAMDDGRAALERLRQPFRKFMFANNGSESVLLAGLLTAIYRPMMQHSPMFCFDASTPGSGKGKLAKCVGLMALGRNPAHMNMDPRDHEFISAFSAVLLAGDPVIWIDNISRAVGGIDLLDSAITEPIAKVRILGVSENRDCPCRALLLATGNNIEFKGDMPRRVLVCRIETDVEKPEEKRFEFDPVKEFSAARPQMVVDALTIFRAYIMAGRPGINDLKPFGSFDDLDLIRGALTWLGMDDPCNTRIDVVPVDDAKSHFAEFVSEWHRHFGERPMTMNEVRQAVLNNPNQYRVMVDAVKFATRQDVESGTALTFDARITGRRLDRWKGVVTGELKFLRVGERNHSALWQVVKVTLYTGQ